MTQVMNIFVINVMKSNCFCIFVLWRKVKGKATDYLGKNSVIYLSLLNNIPKRRRCSTKTAGKLSHSQLSSSDSIA